MADTFTKVTTKSYGSRLIDSIKGVFVGVLMFIASFGLLFWNEGRMDLSMLAKDAVELDSAMVSTDAALQDALVSVTGEVATGVVLGDDLFLDAGSYIAVERVAEMFAWVEETKEDTQVNVGGSETTTTTYTYKKEWTATPQDESEFTEPAGHDNPALSIEGNDYRVEEVRVGAYPVDTKDLVLPSLQALPLNAAMLSLSSGAELSGGYVFLGSGTPASPQVGDTRISYKALAPGFDGTIIGKLDGKKIVQYVDEDNNAIHRLFEGSRAEAISALHDEHVLTTWILRGVGFLMMWLGLAALFGPFATFLDILPMFGSLTRFLVSVVTLPVALALSAVTIIVSMILHNVIAVIIALALALGTVIYLVVRLKNRKKLNMAMPTR